MKGPKLLTNVIKYCEHTERRNDKEPLPKFGKTLQVNLQCSILLLWLPCRYGKSLNSFCICCCILQPSLSSASVMLEKYLMPQLQDHSNGPWFATWRQTATFQHTSLCLFEGTVSWKMDWKCRTYHLAPTFIRRANFRF